MSEFEPLTYTAFHGHNLLAHGNLSDVVLVVRKTMKSDPEASVIVFSDASGKEMDFDLQGTEKEVLARLERFISPGPEAASTGPGRPKLGVVAREISLLPRHWEWLSTQSGGASATIRRLVEDAKKQNSGRETIKQVQERTYKFMLGVAGDLPHYEEALRALYSRDRKKFTSHISDWPSDVKTHALRLSASVFE